MYDGSARVNTRTQCAPSRAGDGAAFRARRPSCAGARRVRLRHLWLSRPSLAGGTPGNRRRGPPVCHQPTLVSAARVRYAPVRNQRGGPTRCPERKRGVRRGGDARALGDRNTLARAGHGSTRGPREHARGTGGRSGGTPKWGWGGATILIRSAVTPPAGRDALDVRRMPRLHDGPARCGGGSAWHERDGRGEMWSEHGQVGGR